ncbi:roadkill-like isoform X1 [Nasonia vitripennis]|uniref:Roadkill n=1 Tax=Nasonia vitripennis TaxID=7425 RepID=A0A7M6UNE3_NASVI|nr:roadkill-like [Nasonia vitripennis]XP_031789344.1 roadkill-like isoform X1 [Nasonia vitripennis]XP_031789345.1 roadkill-like isoform X1 [Nasonia vitripennis]
MAKNVTGRINAKPSVVSYTQEYEWIIDYDRTTDINSEECIRSPVFTTANIYKWQILLYPKGYDEKYQNFYSIFLNLLSNVELKIKASFEIRINKGEPLMTRLFEETMTCYLSSQGYEKFMNRCMIEKSSSLPQGSTIRIACKINLADENVKENNLEMINANRELQQLSTDFEQLIDDKELNDVEFTINGKELRANRSILGKRSSVFSAMFDNVIEVKHAKKVEIIDIRHEVFLEVLRYIYSGKVNGIDTIVDELLAAADKYSLDGLKLMCERSLSSNTNADNVLNNLRLANQYSFNSLKEKAIKFIITQAVDIVDKPEFRQLPYNIVCDICSAIVPKKK